MSKCDSCKRNLSKSSPGLECCKCERIVHLNPKCAGLTNKQITALKAAPNLEWTCHECQQELPRRTSIITPEEDDDESDAPVQIDAKKLLSNISKDVERAIKNEMAQLHESLQFHSAKLDEAMECIEGFKKTIKALERKNTELINKNNNLETRVGALEQRIQEAEQEKLGKYIEISNIPNQTKEDIQLITENIANKLNQAKQDIKSARRLQGRKEQTANILIELIDEEVKEKWMTAARNTKLIVAAVIPNEKTNNNAVYVREAMTKHHKQLFWNAKQELKNNLNYKYVWFKRGLIKARKGDNDKIITLRSIKDIHALTNNKE
ncbi:uncharacterized protein LOC123696052 [Colias croceus]|uniref:uncharacterized protein LOC123692237 n=2 Tax=Colias crocea TaxID=72248 RepID=UPI001E27DFF8|nr:uncharacterized protein LOC123692237 [Colias croceus]XP_045498012.1 uncharacterized protein LOC123696052 [Colias croceus]